MLTTKQKVDRLERIFGQFMTQTNETIARLDRTVERLDRNMERLDRNMERLDRNMERTDRNVERLDHAVGRIDHAVERIDNAIVEMKVQAERDRKEAERDRKALNKRWGDLANKLGTVVEDIVVPNMPRIAKKYFQCEEIDDLIVRRWVRNKKDRSKRREFDVIVVAGDTVILNETKATPRMKYIDDFLDVLPEVVDYFPEYQGKTIIPVFASLYMHETTINYLTRHSVYVMTMGDETMDIVNYKDLQAKE